MSPRQNGPAILTAALRKRLGELLALEAAARDQKEDAVHQMRVASSRLRAILRVYRPAFREGSTTRLEGELAWVAGLLGKERDAEIRAGRLAVLVEGLPQELGGPSAGIALTEHAAVELAAAHRSLMESLDSERYRSLQILAAEFCGRPPLSPKSATRTRLWHQLDDAIERTRRKIARIEPVSRPDRNEELHEVRKVTKRIRYASEVLGAAGDARARRISRRSREVQRILGEQHDASELCARLLTRDGEQSGAGVLAGYLYGIEHGRALEAERAFLSRLPAILRL